VRHAARDATRPRRLHLRYRENAWHLEMEGEEPAGGAFDDLGAALDAAARWPGLVHIIVHERDSSRA